MLLIYHISFRLSRYHCLAQHSPCCSILRRVIPHECIYRFLSIFSLFFSRSFFLSFSLSFIFYLNIVCRGGASVICCPIIDVNQTNWPYYTQWEVILSDLFFFLSIFCLFFFYFCLLFLLFRVCDMVMTLIFHTLEKNCSFQFLLFSVICVCCFFSVCVFYGWRWLRYLAMAAFWNIMKRWRNYKITEIREDDVID